MAEQILNTRIQLKYDTWANWSNDQLGEGKGALFVLKSGEIGICTIPAGVNNAGVQNPPHVLMKVGDGTSTFAALPWMSAKAADVHEWAKAGGVFVERNGSGNVISSIEWDSTLNEGKGGIKYTTASVATAQGLEDLQKEVYGENGSADNSRIDKLEKDIADNQTAWAKDDNTTYTFAKSEKGITITPSEGEAQTITFEYLTQAEIETLLANYYTKGEIDTKFEGYYTKGEVDGLIPTELGVISVAGKEAIVVTDGANPEVSLKLDNSGNVVLAQGNDGLKASIDLSEYRKIADDEDTKYGIAYDSDNKVIKLVEGGANLEISAADFIADGMLEKVEVDNNANTITFTWNTDGGATVTTINLTDIADIYTAAAGATEVQVAISNTNEVSATLVNGGVTEAKLHKDVTDKLNKTWEEVGVAKSMVDVLAGEGNTSTVKANADAIVDITKDNGIIDQKIKVLEESTSDKIVVALAEAQKVSEAVQSNLDDHASNQDVHVTAELQETWNKAVQTIVPGAGLKATRAEGSNEVIIAIDTEITFVFNCGDANTNVETV